MSWLVINGDDGGLHRSTDDSLLASEGDVEIVEMDVSDETHGIETSWTEMIVIGKNRRNWKQNLMMMNRQEGMQRV